MTRRTWTLLTSIVLVAALGLLGGLVRVPYVALGPGPTYDTLGSVGGTPVIGVDQQRTFPTAGHLNMTTVSVTDRISLFGAVGLWMSGRYALAPRDLYFPAGKSEQQIERENTKAFNDSQTTAETAALEHLGYPTKVLAGEIVRGSAADGTIEPGDRVLAVNGQPVKHPQDLQRLLVGSAPGQQVDIAFQRDGNPQRTAWITLGPRPGTPQGFLGVAPTERPDVPFDVHISLADVGGPSAGLMFSLAIIDKLTPGELTGNQFVAGTGEISQAGQVGPIGGIPFKLMAAREAGATTFLVPAENCAEAKSRQPDGLQLARVRTLDDALRALDDLRANKPVPQC